MIFIIAILVTFVLMSYIVFTISKLLRKYRLIKKLYCFPECNFFFGHFLLLTNEIDPNLYISENAAVIANKYFERLRDVNVTVFWFTWVPYIIITNAKSMEAVLANNTLLSKATEYRYFEPWLGSGLFTSEPKKWKRRRKMITPAFHFRILEDFLKTMNEHAMILVDIIKKKNEQVDLFSLIPLTTLDIICETAMGVDINAQQNSNSEFVNAIVVVNETIFNRLLFITYWFDFIFWKSKLGTQFRHSIDYIHEFSRNVINKRKYEIINERNHGSDCNQNTISKGSTLFVGSKKRRIAFIDLLINNHLNSIQKDGSYSFTIDDIFEEVNTFMFGGFDTTAAALCWTLHLLGSHKDIQNKAYEEIATIFDTDTERFVTVDDLNRLKYVECCIKEALRLYPSAAVIGRKTTEEIDVCGQRIPSGVTLVMYIYGLHMDAKYFPQPKDYIPERFLDDNQERRHPYAYIPFSAGQRNCVGQRFAMYEMKTILTNVLRNYRVRSLLSTKDIPVSIEIITRTKSKLYVNFEKRIPNEV